MEITPKIHALRHPFTIPVAPGYLLHRFVYSYIIYGETITLIDTGVLGSDTRIYDDILTAGRDPSEIALIILTHSHADHIGSARAIQEATHCSIAAHPAEKAWIEDISLQNRERPVPGFSTLARGSVQVDHELMDGMGIEIGKRIGRELVVLHTPGHSQGSVSLFSPDEGVLFSGDAVPVEGGIPIYDDAFLSMQSVQRLQGLFGIHHLLSAWDEPRDGEDAYLQMNRAVLWLKRVHEAVLISASTGSPDLMEIAGKTARIIGMPPEAVNPLFARSVAAHLRIKKSDISVFVSP